MKYEEIIQSAAKEYGIDPTMIKAIISVESNWNPNATRWEANIKDTAVGLMQVTTRTAKWVTSNKGITIVQLKNPNLNILVGTRYLAYLKKKYKSTANMIAGYNAGSPRMSKRNPGDYINQTYVDKVRRAYKKYEAGGSNLPLISGLIVGSIGLMLVRR